MRLVIAPHNYSSWSARAWLALGSRVLIDGSLSVHEALAICEYAAELPTSPGTCGDV